MRSRDLIGHRTGDSDVKKITYLQVKLELSWGSIGKYKRTMTQHILLSKLRILPQWEKDLHFFSFEGHDCLLS